MHLSSKLVRHSEHKEISSEIVITGTTGTSIIKVSKIR